MVLCSLVAHKKASVLISIRLLTRVLTGAFTESCRPLSCALSSVQIFFLSSSSTSSASDHTLVLSVERISAPCGTDVMMPLLLTPLLLCRDLKGREEKKERPDPLELPDLLELEDPLEMTVQRVTL